MATMLLPLSVFVAATLLVLLGYLIWARFFDPRSHAKKRRLKTILSAGRQGGQRLSSALGTMQEHPVETWLRSRSGAYRRLEGLVRQTRSPLAAWQLAGIMLALFTAVTAASFLIHANFMLVLLPGIVAAGMPLLWLSGQARRRSKAFGEKLPETIDHISRALRAGHSLTSAIGMVGKEFPDPIGVEFKTVFDEISFGSQFNEAIGQLASRVQSSDLNFFVVSIMIQHETGGNLTELLDGLSKTMRERIKLQGKIRTLSAEGRISAWILGSLPFVFTGIMTLLNPGYISILWSTPQGQTLLLAGSGLMAVGLALLRRIILIKV